MALTTKSSDSMNIYLIGNNPVDLSSIYNLLKSIKNRTYKTEITFDLKGVFRKITRFDPACILIDDNMEKFKLTKLVKRLRSHSRTKHIPIAIIKNSNYEEPPVQDVQEFLWKDSLTPERLQNSILNSIRIKKMQRYLAINYKIKRRQLGKLFQN